MNSATKFTEFLHHAIQRDRRPVAGQAAIGDAAQRVDVRIGACACATLILLWRRIAVAAHLADAVGAGSTGVPRRAEVDQHRLSYFAVTQDDVARRDIAMQQPLIVHGVQRIAERAEHFCQRLRSEPAMLGQMLTQRFAWHILHDEICRTVFFKIILNAGDVGVVASHQAPALLDEIGEPTLEYVAVLGLERFDVALLCAARERERHPLLHGERLVVLSCATEVGNGEAAAAQDALNAQSRPQERSGSQRSDRAIVLHGGPLSPPWRKS